MPTADASGPKDLLDHRELLGVLTAFRKGDFSARMTPEYTGVAGRIADVLNEVIERNERLAQELERIRNTVGKEGKLGQRASLGAVSGGWATAIDSVNSLIVDLVQPNAEVTRVIGAVARGDLTGSIAQEAPGELAALKDNVNQMIATLRETTQKNAEQDWLKTNLLRFTRVLEGQRNLEAVARLILKELAPLVSAQQGVFYLMDSTDAVGHDEGALKMVASYAYRERRHLSNRFKVGEGLVGQCVLERERILLTEVPENYVKIASGLGEATPRNIVVLPVVFEGVVKAVIELASLYRFREIHLAFLDQLTESVGVVLNTLAAGTRTEELEERSQLGSVKKSVSGSCAPENKGDEEHGTRREADEVDGEDERRGGARETLPRGATGSNAGGRRAGPGGGRRHPGADHGRGDRPGARREPGPVQQAQRIHAPLLCHQGCRGGDVEGPTRPQGHL